MAKNYVKPGEHITFTAGATIQSGQPIAIGVMVAVALVALTNGEQGEAAIEGVWELPKANTFAITAGQSLVFDPDTSSFIETAAEGDIVGGAVAIAGADLAATTVHAKLCPGAGAIEPAP